LIGNWYSQFALIFFGITDMSAHWKRQLQEIIDLSRDRIHRLEAAELTQAGDAPPLEETTKKKIEAEMKVIARLQQTMDALP
jgi:hypothetical protein